MVIYPEKTIIEKETCIPMFTAALFTTARTWKQPRCPLTDEWLKKLGCRYTMDYYQYSALNRNTFESVLVRNIEPVMQSEESQEGKKQILYINAYTWNLRK